jgi:3-deoxy-D-manno-octulosonate 8-phosphate phosphatase (KDO 8-P phosphatase)
MSLTANDVSARARRVRLLLFDVDGVLTDGTVVIGPAGQETKTFSIRDGAALVWAKQAGLEVGLLSGRRSEATTIRAKELGIDLIVQGSTNKRDDFAKILADRKITAEQVGYMGDDVVDLTVMSRVGLGGAPSDAVPEVLARAHWVSARPGGRGAVREFIELILKARGQWDAVLTRVQD